MIWRKVRKALFKCALFFTLCFTISGVFLTGTLAVSKLLEKLNKLTENSRIITESTVTNHSITINDGDTQSATDKIYTAISRKYDVVLSSYMNSGSTYTGRILGFRPNSFYFYEPLWHLNEWSYYRTNFTMCSSRVPSCRKVTMEDMNRNRPVLGVPLDFTLLHDEDILHSLTVHINIPQRILEHVFNCKLRRLQNIIEPSVTAAVRFSGPSWNSYRYCMQKRKKMETCLTDLESVCSDATHRVSKVLRLTISAAEPLLRQFPNLKIIHLFRDPRAIINSRIETLGYPLKFVTGRNLDIIRNAKTLCDKMAIDFDDGRDLMQKFPNRFRFIHYEDIYQNDDALIKLHNYLGMTLTKRDLNGAKLRKINAPQRKNAAQEEERKNNNSFWWRRYMSWGAVELVDGVCKNVCRSLGYPYMSDEEELRNSNINETMKNLNFLL